MLNDCDLVVVGASPEGIYAAITAIGLQARVALITQSDTGYLDSGIILGHCLNEWGRLNAETQNDLQFSRSLAQVKSWEEGVKENSIAENSLSSAATLGVDVIVGKGEFCRSPHLAFNIGKRKLRSRFFLLATGAKHTLDRTNIDGVLESNCLVYSDLLRLDLSKLPEKIAIVGSSPRSLELAQSLARFGKKIVLIVDRKRLLAAEDIDTARLMQSHLEAVGIEIILDSQVTQVKQLQGKKWLQAGNRAIETEEIIFCDRTIPNIEGLNLAGVEVKYNSAGIAVNNKLQTTNSQIYACGNILGGYASANIAIHEVNLALKNMLFFPLFKIDYRCVPWGILTQPNIMRVGLKETQAKQNCDRDIYIVKEYFKSTIQAQVVGKTTGWCKLLVAETGDILGCTIIGDRATELITIVALMMKYNIKFSNNLMKGMTTTEIPYMSPSFAEIFSRLAHNYYLQKLQKKPQLLKRLKIWFKH